MFSVHRALRDISNSSHGKKKGRLIVRQDSPLFQVLSKVPPDWWKNLVTDQELIIQVRKDKTIDVYYNGGCILTGLTYSTRENSYSAEINYKYLPLSVKKNYASVCTHGDSIDVVHVKTASLNNFDENTLKRIKNLISNYYPRSSEKAIQHSFYRHDPYFIDTEFQWTEDGKKNRIDLVRIDKQSKTIVFVEVKTIGDRRVYTEELPTQLRAYQSYLEKNNGPAQEYWDSILQIKRKLGILSPELKDLDGLRGFSLNKKPLLLFGDCEQSWIDTNSSSIDNRVRSCALGVYYFGRPKFTSDILNKTSRNRHVF